MIFITGPLYSGKREYARLLLGCTREELAQRADAVVRVFCGIPVYLKGAPNT